MPNLSDYKTEWEKTKKQLVQFSKEALEVAKKGEQELIKLSKRSKLHVDSTAISLQKEKLYYFIGKEYVKTNDTTPKSTKLKKLVAELRAAEKQQKALQVKIKKTNNSEK
ncbi:MAG: hypothetical protein KKF78_10510 [Candidatus Omnitrophica bacterium]|nr:hypothetical protein [Candidatus Omnitrophota bacterium]MBU1997573.1 hypothetical protein [Candidatus Omnitrophota bacterium]